MMIQLPNTKPETLACLDDYKEYRYGTLYGSGKWWKTEYDEFSKLTINTVEGIQRSNLWGTACVPVEKPHK